MLRLERSDLISLATLLLCLQPTLCLPLIAQVTSVAATAKALRQRRGVWPKHYMRPAPLDWSSKVSEMAWNQPRGEKRFERLFKVTYDEFVELSARIKAKRGAKWAAEAAQKPLGKSGKISKRRGRKPLAVELQLAMTLRYLAGGSYLDIMLWANIVTHSTFYRSVYNTLKDLDDILPNPTLATDLSNPARLDALSEGFLGRSYGWIRGCIGAVDGLLVPITAPANEPGAGAAKYFTRKGFFALNLQGVCDSEARITYFSMKFVGSTHDSYAWSRDSLARRVASGGDAFEFLSTHGYHLIGDEAYTAGATFATPWSSRSCKDPASREERLAYNYYHSAARITIERTFGQLTKRFLLLKRPFSGDLEQTPHAPGLLLVVRCCVKLHNLAVDRGTYRKFTPNLPDKSPCVKANNSYRANHRGEFEDVADHTLLSSPDDWCSGGDEVSAWFDVEGTLEASSCSSSFGAPSLAGTSLYDKEYLNQIKAGHNLTRDCAVRAAHTRHMKEAGCQRPTAVHW